jgi:transposase-like protein
MGVLERGGNGEPSRVRAKVVPDTSKRTLHAEIAAAVAEGSEVFTDAHAGYQGLTEQQYRHDFVDHAVRYVEGRVHTNGLENFWSLTKRALKGTYVSVEPEHLMAYLDEQAFRFNLRKGCDAFRFTRTLMQVQGKRLTYRNLIGNPQGIDSPDPLRGGPRAD